MKTIKIAGVPEHFNFPWHLCIDKGEFREQSIDLQWIDVPEGTGKMCQMLREGQTDMAVILTEGMIKDIAAGNPSKIIQVYVHSPLIWGIHITAQSNYKKISDLQNKKAAISREGSGSQLMAYIFAKNQGWKTDHLQFVVVNTLDGAVEALTNGSADYFMWDHFMTKPLVDDSIFRRIGDCPTPWPSFVIAARDEILENEASTVAEILKIINRKTAQFKNIPKIDQTLASKFNLKLKDVQEWLSLTEWSQKVLSEKQLNHVQTQLFQLKLIDRIGPSKEFVKVL